MAVVSPPWMTARSHTARRVELMYVGSDLHTLGVRQCCRVNPRPGHDNHSQVWHAFPSRLIGLDHLAQQTLPDARSADGHDAHLLICTVAEFGANSLAVGEVSRIKSRHISGKVEMFPRPVTDRR